MVGERIRMCRNAFGLTLKELGEKFNLAESTISLYESGKRKPDFDTLKKFAEFFNVSTDFLLGVEENVVYPLPVGKAITTKIKDLLNETGLKLYELFPPEKFAYPQMQTLLDGNRPIDTVELSVIAKHLHQPVEYFLPDGANSPDKEPELSNNPDIRMIARAGKKMTPEQAENLRRYAQFMFPEAFKDDDT